MTERIDERSEDSSRSSHRSLWAVFDVTVADRCPLTDIEEPITSVTSQQIATTCKCEVITDEADVNVLRLERERDANCLADIFHQHNCVPHITGVTHDSLIITFHPPDRETIPALLKSLRAADYDVTTERIRDLRDFEDDSQSTALLDASILTEKQREALDAALKAGYYDDDKGITLARLANEELDISQSALSRRLRAAESKLLRDTFRIS